MKTYNHRIGTVEIAERWLAAAKSQPGRWVKTDRPSAGSWYHLFRSLGLEAKQHEGNMCIRWIPETLFVDSDPTPPQGITRPAPVPAVTEIRGFLDRALSTSGATVEHIAADVWLVRWSA